jgi:HEAT repeat protein
MKRAILVFSLTLWIALAALPLMAAGDDAAQGRERTRQVLLYGIDSEVLDVVQKLKATGESSFAAELAQILAEKRGAGVRRTILELFADTKGKEGEQAASAILRAWQDEPPEVVVAAVQYLSAIAAEGRAPLLAPLAESPLAAVSSSAIRALGGTRDPAAADLLLKLLDRPDMAEADRTGIILALGEAGDRRAVAALLSIAKNRDEDKVRRMYAADSLGKLGDPSALPVLRDMFGEKDALVRAYAASGLAHFDVEEAFPQLLAGLKDENWKVRAECARAFARPLSEARSAEALPVLSYKAELDPTPQVRLEAIRALGAIGGEKSNALLIGLYRSRTSTLAAREESLAILVRTALPAGLEAVRAVVAEEWKAVDQKVVQMTARVLSTAASPQARDLLVKFLDSPNPVVRIYGVRGIASARLADLRERIRGLAEKDPHPAVQREAAKALEKL